MPKNWGCHGNYKSVKLHCVHLYETLHLEMAAHFQKVTETGPSLKHVLLRYRSGTQDALTRSLIDSDITKYHVRTTMCRVLDLFTNISTTQLCISSNGEYTRILALFHKSLPDFLAPSSSNLGAKYLEFKQYVDEINVLPA